MSEEQLVLVALAETTKKYADAEKNVKECQKKKGALRFYEDITQDHVEEATVDAEEETQNRNSKEEKGEKRKLSQKLRLATVKLRMPRPDFSRLLGALNRPDFSRLRTTFNNVNCFRSEVDTMPVMDIERHKSVDLGLRRTSLFFFRRKASICLHPYHPYTPKQETRLVWNVSHNKT